MQPERTGGERASAGHTHQDPKVIMVPPVGEMGTRSQNSAAESSPPTPVVHGHLREVLRGPRLPALQSRLPGGQIRDPRCWIQGPQGEQKGPEASRVTQTAGPSPGHKAQPAPGGPVCPAPLLGPEHTRGCRVAMFSGRDVECAFPGGQVTSWLCCQNSPFLVPEQKRRCPSFGKESADNECKASPSESQGHAGGVGLPQGAGRVEGRHSGPGARGRTRSPRPFCLCMHHEAGLGEGQSPC